MQKKNLITAAMFALGFVVLALIPIKQLSLQMGLARNSVLITIITKSLIFFVFARWIVRKYDLGKWGGFKDPVWRNQWMVLLPLIYPGALYFSRLSFNNVDQPVAELILTCLAAGFFEEITFRGLIQGYLIKNTIRPNYHRIFIFTAFLFAIGHFENLRQSDLISVSNQAAGAFVIGLLFSAIQFRANNIWLLGFAHSLFNFMTSLAGKDIEVNSTDTLNLLDLVTGIGSMILIYSPLLLVYWVLTRNINNATKKLIRKAYAEKNL